MGAHGSANRFDHLAFSYSGPTAAHAYVHLDAGRFKRIFILGPSHHVHLEYVCCTPDLGLLRTMLHTQQCRALSHTMWILPYVQRLRGLWCLGV
jgi:hypothetical protein